MRVYDVVKKEQDYTGLAWGERVNSSGTAGTYLKAKVGAGSRSTFYKLPRFNGIEFDGHECVNEIVASRLLRLLGVEHLEYRLVRARVLINGIEHHTWVNTSKNFRGPGEKKMALGSFVDLHGEPGASPFDVCRSFGWDDQIRQMMLVDYLIANRDRHSSNIEVIIARDGRYRLAPIFDNGLSFVAPFAGQEDAIRAFDPLRRVATMNYIGSRFLEDNLEMAMPVSIQGGLSERDKDYLFANLDEAVPQYVLDKMWEIVWQRWQHYASL